MNNKKLLAFFIALIIIVIFVIWGLQRCEPRVKDENGNSLTTSEEDLTGTSGKTAEDYYNAFINANIDFTCQIKKDPSLPDNEALFKERLNKAYKDNGLPVDNDSLMIDILNKYENDQGVIKIVRENTQNCP